MKKKLVCIILAAAVGSALLAGCGSDDSSSSSSSAESELSSAESSSSGSTEETADTETTESGEGSSASTDSSDSSDSSESSGTTEDTAAESLWADGTYTATAAGKISDFEVTVTIENGVITDVSIGENEETENRGAIAVEYIPSKIVKAQSAEVDVITGATVTSEAIMDAVAECLAEAEAAKE